MFNCLCNLPASNQDKNKKDPSKTAISCPNKFTNKLTFFTFGSKQFSQNKFLVVILENKGEMCSQL